MLEAGESTGTGHLGVKGTLAESEGEAEVKRWGWEGEQGRVPDEALKSLETD